MAVIWGYLGAVLGAGFVSGQEVMVFFLFYGAQGLWGVVMATAMFILLGGILLSWCHRWQISSYQSLMQSIMGPKGALLVEAALLVFLFLGICTMLAASGAVFYEHFYLAKEVGIGLAYLTVIFFLIKGYKGLVQAYNYLVPVKILLLLFITSTAVLRAHPSAEITSEAYQLADVGYSWIMSGLIYVAYNFALAMVVLTEYQKITKPRQGVWGGALGGLALGVLLTLTYLALKGEFPAVTHYQVPMLFVAQQISYWAKGVYLAVLWLGILTTALANCYGFAQRLSGVTALPYPTCLLLSATMALPISCQKFSVLVSTLYPLFGVVGVIILLMLVLKYCQVKWKGI